MSAVFHLPVLVAPVAVLAAEVVVAMHEFHDAHAVNDNGSETSIEDCKHLTCRRRIRLLLEAGGSIERREVK